MIKVATISKNSTLITILVSLLYIALNTILIANEFYWLTLLPVAALIVYFYFVSLDKILLLITLLTPLAINIRDYDMSIGISLPTEPLMFGVLIFFVFRIIYKSPFETKVFKHPVSIAIIINLCWMLITSITSEIPLVSFKYLLSRLWFVVPFYFFGILLFKEYKNIKTFSWMYLISLLAVIVFTTYKHSTFGFDKDIGHYVMQPFYNDHTAYGAALAMFVPVIVGFILNREYTTAGKLISFTVFAIIMVALIFSRSRAAWISVAGALGIYLLIRFRIKFWFVFSVLVVLIVAFFSFQTEIFNKLSKNKQDSSADLAEHVQSISNITSDASNLERINRWKSAFKMFDERPFWGWGPGTYQFVYAPFQNSQDLTIISTNAGDMGNAHSEYIGPLAESGVIGLITVLGIVIAIFYTAIKNNNLIKSKKAKYLNMIFMLGLATYFMHGLLNNFLDSDKLSVPVWGFAAIIVAIDLYHKYEVNEISEEV
jgi:putative inorganic carbon (HCO3(-)) transporter